MTRRSNGSRGLSPSGPEGNLALTAQLFATAVNHHQRGQLAEAEAIYRKILANDPRNTESLHHLGVAALQQGRAEEAASLIGQSLALNDRNAEGHYHLGLALAGLRRFADTAAHNRRAVALKPDYAEAHMNLGNALKELGQLNEAVACYESAIKFKPSLAEAHFNLANVLADRRNPDAAIKAYERALTVQPNYPEALQNLGTVLLMHGRADEAIAKFSAALTAKPNFTEALLGQALALMQKGNPVNALGVICRALDINATEDAKQLFVECVKTPGLNLDAPWLRKHLISALTEPWDRPRSLAAFAANVLRSPGAIADIYAAALKFGSADFRLSSLQIAAMANDRLLLTVLENAAVIDPALERLLIAARRELLDTAAKDSSAAKDSLLAFACALARQCFINEYLFDVTAEETARVQQQRDSLATAFDSATPPSPLLLAVMAAYSPLHAIPDADRMLAQSWPQHVEALLTQQLRDTQHERRLREAMPQLTPVEDNVSLEVQRQYEENPYPRWVKVQASRRKIPFDAYVRKTLPQTAFRQSGKAGCDILIAGCGTGQDPIEFAQLVAGAQILAVDLSKSSLGHAQRKTLELDIKTIEYAQADILKLPAIARTFDFIASVGVLHHMADPFAAWRGLLTLLRPDGLMLLGFYSKLATAHIVAARAYIAESGFQATPEGIRSARRAILALPDDSLAKQVSRYTDFFSTSECRDLLFHVHEHRLTVPQIKAFIAENGLQFLGFDIGQHVIGRYRMRFPLDQALTNLDNWDAFEQDNPRTFSGMYQFLVQKPVTAP